MNSKGQPGFLPKGFATMSPLAWWIDYCMGAAYTNVTRFPMFYAGALRFPMYYMSLFRMLP